MSSRKVHVHESNHELIELTTHATQHEDSKSERNINQIAILTAVVAALSSIVSFYEGDAEVKASLYKADAAINKTEAANQWAYYQAKSLKRQMQEVLMETNTIKRDIYAKEISRYESEMQEIQQQAKNYEDKALELERQSNIKAHIHHSLARATTALQISIGVGAIALITRRKWLTIGAFILAGSGAVLVVATALGL
jgi:hypothetical protein